MFLGCPEQGPAVIAVFTYIGGSYMKRFLKVFFSLPVRLSVGIILILGHSATVAQWQQVGTFTTKQINTLAVYGSRLYASVNFFGGGIYVSKDGTTWTPPGPTIFGRVVYDLAGSGPFLYAATDQYVYMSTDSGATWTEKKNGLSNAVVWSVSCRDSTVFAGTYKGLCRSTTHSSAWTELGSGLNLVSCDGLLATDTRVFVGEGQRTFVSSDNGETWGILLAQSTRAFVEIDGTVFGGCSGLFRLGPGDTAWTPQGNLPDSVDARATDGRYLFAGTISGVSVSTDRGLTWTNVSANLAQAVKSLAVWGSYLYAGTYTAGVWRRPLVELATDVGEVNGAARPTGLEISQNYPNPFNPSTTIRYGLPNRSHVTLTVFNTLGQQVALLQNGEQEAGYHEVKFDGSGLSSGVYYYRLTAGTFVEMKKLLLVR